MAAIQDFTCPYCTREHLSYPPYAGGCPFGGIPPKSRPVRRWLTDAEQVRAHEMNQHVQGVQSEIEAWKQEEADQRAEWRRAIEGTKLAIMREEYHEHRDAERQAAMEQIHEMLDGARAADRRERRERIRRLIQRSEPRANS
jgi:hypothetical protein